MKTIVKKTRPDQRNSNTVVSPGRDDGFWERARNTQNAHSIFDVASPELTATGSYQHPAAKLT